LEVQVLKDHLLPTARNPHRKRTLARTVGRGRGVSVSRRWIAEWRKHSVELRQENSDDVIAGRAEVITRAHNAVQVQAERGDGVNVISRVRDLKELIIRGLNKRRDVRTGACEQRV
jgi:hypothetical protein